MGIHRHTQTKLNEIIKSIDETIKEYTSELDQLYLKPHLREYNVKFINHLTLIHNFLMEFNTSNDSLKSLDLAKLRAYANSTPGMYNVSAMLFFISLAIVCAAIAALIVINTPQFLALTVIFSYFALNCFCVGAFVFGIRQGISSSLYNLANDLEKEQEFENLTTKLGEKADEILSAYPDDAWHQAIPFLRVLDSIQNANDLNSLVQAQQKFDAIRPWTYMGFFPLKDGSSEDKAVNVLNQSLEQKRAFA